MYMQIDLARRILAHRMRRREDKRIGPILAMLHNTTTSGAATEVNLSAFGFFEHPGKVLSIAESDRWTIPFKMAKAGLRSIGEILKKPEVGGHVDGSRFSQKGKNEKRIRHDGLKKF
jgi:hypothetical protein